MLLIRSTATKYGFLFNLPLNFHGIHGVCCSSKHLQRTFFQPAWSCCKSSAARLGDKRKRLTQWLRCTTFVCKKPIRLMQYISIPSTLAAYGPSGLSSSDISRFSSKLFLRMLRSALKRSCSALNSFELCVLPRLNRGSTFLSAFSMPSNLGLAPLGGAQGAAWICWNAKVCWNWAFWHQDSSMDCSFYRWLIHIPGAFHVKRWLWGKKKTGKPWKTHIPKVSLVAMENQLNSATGGHYAPRPKLYATIRNLASLLQICFTCRRIEGNI